MTANTPLMSQVMMLKIEGKKMYENVDAYIVFSYEAKIGGENVSQRIVTPSFRPSDCPEIPLRLRGIVDEPFSCYLEVHVILDEFIFNCVKVHGRELPVRFDMLADRVVVTAGTICNEPEIRAPLCSCLLF